VDWDSLDKRWNFSLPGMEITPIYCQV